MAILQEIVYSLVTLVNIFFTILYWMLVARILLSLFGVNPYTHYNELLGVLYQVTDAILLPLRKLPLQIGMFDFSPMLAFVILQLLQRLIVMGLYMLGGVR